MEVSSLLPGGETEGEDLPEHAAERLMSLALVILRPVRTQVNFQTACNPFVKHQRTRTAVRTIDRVGTTRHRRYPFSPVALSR